MCSDTSTAPYQLVALVAQGEKWFLDRPPDVRVRCGTLEVGRGELAELVVGDILEIFRQRQVRVK